MKNVMNDLKRLFLYLGVLTLAVNLTSCSNDDDGSAPLDPTGSFDLASEEYTLTGNTITLESITVGQKSWLVAVDASTPTSSDFIADPVMLQVGENEDVDLEFDEDAISDDEDGQQVVLKLYTDTGATVGSWDTTDQPIRTSNNTILTETITVMAEDDGTAAFADFDEDESGFLEADEVPASYQNNFEEWDADGDNNLSSVEFYNTLFANTDADDNNAISEAEWDTGFAGMFGNWSEDDFATFDADASQSLNIAEWNTTFGESDWFETYDANSNTFVTEDEWNTGLFEDWDADADNRIDQDEYDLYSPYVTNW